MARGGKREGAGRKKGSLDKRPRSSPVLIAPAEEKEGIGHHTTAREAGAIFARTKPQARAFTHLVFLASQHVRPASVDELIAETRQTTLAPSKLGKI